MDNKKIIYSYLSVAATTAGFFLVYKYFRKSSQNAKSPKTLKHSKKYVQQFTSGKNQDQQSKIQPQNLQIPRRNSEIDAHSIIQNHEKGCLKDSIKIKQNVRAQSSSVQSRLEMRRQRSGILTRSTTLDSLSTIGSSEQGDFIADLSMLSSYTWMSNVKDYSDFITNDDYGTGKEQRSTPRCYKSLEPITEGTSSGENTPACHQEIRKRYQKPIQDMRSEGLYTEIVRLATEMNQEIIDLDSFSD